MGFKAKRRVRAGSGWWRCPIKALYSIVILCCLALSLSSTLWVLPGAKDGVFPKPCFGMLGLLGTHVHNGVVVKNGFWEDVLWGGKYGNRLSPYWAARTMAELGGFKYRGDPFEIGTWMEYLPTHAEARPPRLDLYERVCQQCDSWMYFHECDGWSFIADTIGSDTRSAMDRFVAEQSKAFQQKLNIFQPNDWLIYERCCIGCHRLQTFRNIDAYSVLPSEGNFTVYTLNPPIDKIDKNEGHYLCKRLHKLRDDYIRRHNPGIRIVALTDGDVAVDFARLIYAPNLVVPSTGSSFAVWAYLANTGNVHVAEPMPGFDMSRIPRLHRLPGRSYTPTSWAYYFIGRAVWYHDESSRQAIIDWFLTKSR